MPFNNMLDQRKIPTDRDTDLNNNQIILNDPVTPGISKETWRHIIQKLTAGEGITVMGDPHFPINEYCHKEGYVLNKFTYPLGFTYVSIFKDFSTSSHLVLDGNEITDGLSQQKGYQIYASIENGYPVTFCCKNSAVHALKTLNKDSDAFKITKTAAGLHTFYTITTTDFSKSKHFVLESSGDNGRVVAMTGEKMLKNMESDLPLPITFLNRFSAEETFRTLSEKGYFLALTEGGDRLKTVTLYAKYNLNDPTRLYEWKMPPI